MHSSIQFATVAFVVGFAVSASAQGQVPQLDAMWGYSIPTASSKVPYQVLSRPSHHHDDKLTVEKNSIETKPVKPYAYGWFGTQPAPKWSRSFGTRSEYTQWTLK